MNLLKGNEDLSWYLEDWGDKRGLSFLKVSLVLPCFRNSSQIYASLHPSSPKTATSNI